LATVADERLRMPEKIDVICTIRKTAKVMPSRSAKNLLRSFTSSL
jgi:hypothetical protein